MVIQSVSFAEWMTPYWRIIAENKVVTDDFESFVGYKNTGYHLDAVKFANYLKREYCHHVVYIMRLILSKIVSKILMVI